MSHAPMAMGYTSMCDFRKVDLALDRVFPARLFRDSPIDALHDWPYERRGGTSGRKVHAL